MRIQGRARTASLSLPHLCAPSSMAPRSGDDGFFVISRKEEESDRRNVAVVKDQVTRPKSEVAC